ncbi:MAG: dihydroorotase [Candidatus Margulisbacteria bacterium]|nr:dihydroorotase [Candidatus Margulisiibacteriota bacterium]
MTILLKNAQIVNIGSVEQKDILIDNKGRVANISQNINDAADAVYDLSGKYIFPGFIDLHVHLREPGNEEKETLSTGLKAAVFGGYTAVCTMPNTEPVIDNKFLIKFLKDRAWEVSMAKLYPTGSITKGLKGQEISEYASMIRNGAVAFTDDGLPVANMSTLRKALEYLSIYDKPLFLHCEDIELAEGGSMNEGNISTKIGLPGIHRAAEESAISQAIELAKYFGKIHIAHVSTKGSVDILRFAKQRGIKVTAETAPHYFVLTEDAVEGYNTNAKMNPPLRTEEDRKAIIEGLRDGTIDVIATDHAPHTTDDKNKEFNLASFGIIGLETAIMLIMNTLYHEEGFSLEKICSLCSTNPAKIIDVSSGKIAKGELADFTVIDSNLSWSVTEQMFHSKSKNSPFVGFTGKGRAVMTIVDGKVVWKEKNIG